MAGNDTRGLTTKPYTDGLPPQTGPAHYVDGAVGTPNPAVPPPGNPWIDPATGEKYPGAPGAK